MRASSKTTEAEKSKLTKNISPRLKFKHRNIIPLVIPIAAKYRKMDLFCTDPPHHHFWKYIIILNSRLSSPREGSVGGGGSQSSIASGWLKGRKSSIMPPSVKVCTMYL